MKGCVWSWTEALPLVGLQVLLMSRVGSMIYCGPREQLQPFLESCGHVWPADYNMADFVLDTMSEMTGTALYLPLFQMPF